MNHDDWLAGLVTQPKYKIKDKLSQEKDPNLWGVLLIFFIIALIPRLYFLFFVSTPDNPGAGWFGDAYHHWQIAYLTKEIGLNNGFLRLWDLKGMEFFWGLLHPILTMFSFLVTGSVSVAVERAATGVMGSISVIIVYLLGKKYWNTKVAVSAALLAALNPVGIFNDVSGMVEPFGIVFLLLSVYFWYKKPFLTGLSLSIALMARAEYWVFAVGMIIAMVIVERKKINSNTIALLIVGFLIPTLLYMKYLLDWTGNPIYPFYWNYVTNIFGTWQYKTEFSQSDIIARWIFRGIFALSLLFSLLVLWKKPKGATVYLLGLGNWLFLGASIGLGAYIGSYANYVWYVRFMILPYIFLGFVISVFLFDFLPRVRFLKYLDKFKINWIILPAFLAVIQPVWILIMNKYEKTEVNWVNAVYIAGEINKHYKDGKMVFVEGNPEFTYALVKVYGFSGKNLISQMFDPYFYFNEDPYKNWDDYREKVFSWITDNEIKLIVTYQGTEKYTKLLEFEPEFISIGTPIPNSNLIVYRVDNEKIKREF